MRRLPDPRRLLLERRPPGERPVLCTCHPLVRRHPGGTLDVPCLTAAVENQVGVLRNLQEAGTGQGEKRGTRRPNRQRMNGEGVSPTSVERPAQEEVRRAFQSLQVRSLLTDTTRSLLHPARARTEFSCPERNQTSDCTSGALFSPLSHALNSMRGQTQIPRAHSGANARFDAVS